MAIPAHLRNHHLFAGGRWGAMSGEKPRYPSIIEPTHENLVRALKGMGLQHLETHGRYGEPERSVIVYNPSQDQMTHLGRMFGQESVIHSQGGLHKLIYTHGPSAGQYHMPAPGQDSVEFFQDPPEDFYTHLPGAGNFRINFDFDKLHQDPGEPQQVPAAQGMKKSLAQIPVMIQPRAPHSYEWHDGHTDHHRAPDPTSPVPGLRKDDSQGPQLHPTNAEAAPVGTAANTYHKFAAPYGHLTPGKPTNLRHYDYENKLPEIENLVKQHGFKTYYAGGKYGKPDLANKNYNTGHLMIYDPSPDSGASFGHEQYNRSYRQIHELAHALTYPEVNKIYGEGRRIGRLGVHRSLNEAARAVHWEWLAAHKQRELGRQIGVHVSDEDFNRELNTVMHDALHRAVHGKFTEPSEEGFNPHPHQVPLGTAMDILREEAQKLGLQHAHHTLKKAGELVIFSENKGSSAVADQDQKTHTPEEVAQILMKAAREKIAAFEADLRELRSRELKKALVPPHKHTVGTTSSAGIEDVAPGKLDKAKELGHIQKPCPLCNEKQKNLSSHMESAHSEEMKERRKNPDDAVVNSLKKEGKPEETSSPFPHEETPGELSKNATMGYGNVANMGGPSMPPQAPSLMMSVKGDPRGVPSYKAEPKPEKKKPADKKGLREYNQGRPLVSTGDGNSYGSKKPSLDEYDNPDMDKAELCKSCGKMHVGKCMDKAMLSDSKGKQKDNGIAKDSVLPGDAAEKEVSAEGSGGQIKKGKSVAAMRKAAMEATRKAESVSEVEDDETAPARDGTEGMNKVEPLAKPSTSGAQHRAMEAAAHGHSTLGIPKKVGKEFAEADKGKHFGKTAMPPMAKPPSGKNMGTSVPTSAPKAPAIKSAMEAPAMKKELAKAKIPGAPAHVVSPETGRADTWAGEGRPEAHEVAAKPKFGLGDLAAGKQKLVAAGVKPVSGLASPKVAGIAAAPVKPSPVSPAAAAPAAPAVAAKPGIFGRLQGKK